MNQTIKRVQFRNFKCHDMLNLGFKEGLTVIVAPNGKGKSSLLQGIAWCLFGPSAVDLKQEELIRDGQDYCEGHVCIELDGQDCIFNRSFSKKEGAKASVEIDGQVVADKSSGVAEFLKSRGIDYDGFRMIYAEQGELSFLVKVPASVRKQLISSLFQVDKLDESIKSARSDYRTVKGELEELPSEDYLENLNAKISDLQQRKSLLEEKRSETFNELEELKGKLVHKSDAVRTIPERNELESKAAALESSIGALEEEMKQLYSVIPEVLDIEEGVLEESTQKIGTYKEEINTLKNRETYLGSLIRDAKEKLDILDQDTVCPICGNESDLTDYIVNLEDEVLKHSEECKEISSKLKTLQAKLYKEEIKHESLLDQVQAVSWWESSGSGSRLEVIKEKIEEYNSSLNKIEGKIKKLPVIDIDEIDALQLQIDSVKDELSEIEKDIRFDEYRIDDLIEKARDAIQEIDSSVLSRKKEERLSVLVKELTKFRDVTMSQSLEWVGHRASSLMSSALGRSKTVTIDTDLGFWVNGRKLEAYSSGQIDLACVCIRIAIAEYLSKRIGFRGLLILDGVFDRIDEDNRDAIGRLLSEVNIGQVIVLSHFEVPIIGGRELRFR